MNKDTLPERMRIGGWGETVKKPATPEGLGGFGGVTDGSDTPPTLGVTHSGDVHEREGLSESAEGQSGESTPVASDSPTVSGSGDQAGSS